MDPTKSALILIDLQNDFVHPEGACGRAQACFDIDPIVEPVTRAVRAARTADVLLVSLHHTIRDRSDTRSLFRPDMKRAIPALRADDFRPGSFGHRLFVEFEPSDICVEKTLPSGFANTRLLEELEANEIDTLVLAGITTNFSVAATFHDARKHGFNVFVLRDGCAAISRAVHEASLESLQRAASDERIIIGSRQFCAELIAGKV